MSVEALIYCELNLELGIIANNKRWRIISKSRDLDIKIHKQFEESGKHLKAFVGMVFSNDKDLERSVLASMTSNKNQGIYSCSDENGFIVVATTHQSAWHPHCVYVRLAYNLNRIDKGALKQLINELKLVYEQPLFFFIDNRFKGLDQVLLDERLRFIRKTEVITFYPQKREEIEPNRKIKAVSEITKEPVWMNSLFELCKTIYTETHIDNPVGDFPLASWKRIIMEDLNEENSYVVINENKVIAFSLMHQVEKFKWELGWIGVEQHSELSLLDDLITMQLNDAIKLGIVEIEKEVDSTCLYSLHIAETLSYDVSETLYAFIS